MNDAGEPLGAAPPPPPPPPFGEAGAAAAAHAHPHAHAHAHAPAAKVKYMLTAYDRSVLVENVVAHMRALVDDGGAPPPPIATSPHAAGAQ